MRSRDLKESDKQTTLTKNQLFVNKANIIRLKLATKNQHFDYVDKTSIRKTNDRENKKYHTIKRLHKTSGENEQKPNLIMILSKILAPEDDIQNIQKCPQCCKFFLQSVVFDATYREETLRYSEVK